MKKLVKKLVLAKETVSPLADTRGGGDGPAPVDTITYWPEQCTGGSCLPRNC